MWNNCLKEPNFLEILLLKSLSFEIKTNPENCLTVICTGFKFNAFSDENRFKTFFLEFETQSNINFLLGNNFFLYTSLNEPLLS